MTWQLAIVLQILASSAMTMYTRRLTLSVKHVFFGVALCSYIAVAAAGWFYAVLSGQALLIPPHAVWPYLLVEGICIPAAWLTQYKLISFIGAANTAIAIMLNNIVAALAGIIFLHDRLTVSFLLGGLLVMGGVGVALRLQPDTEHHSSASLPLKVTLTLGGAFLYGLGMMAEKVAVNHVGVWNYAGFGWSMQVVGAILLFVLFGRQEWPYLTAPAKAKGLLLGLLTSVAGLLYIYALSIGSLSHTIIAISGKPILVMMLAALFLHERNAWRQRVAALALTALGLALVLG